MKAVEGSPDLSIRLLDKSDSSDHESDSSHQWSPPVADCSGAKQGEGSERCTRVAKSWRYLARDMGWGRQMSGRSTYPEENPADNIRTFRVLGRDSLCRSFGKNRYRRRKSSEVKEDGKEDSIMDGQSRSECDVGSQDIVLESGLTLKDPDDDKIFPDTCISDHTRTQSKRAEHLPFLVTDV